MAKKCFSTWSYGAVWAAYYTDGKTEAVELKTQPVRDEGYKKLSPEEQKVYITMGKANYHNEKPVGTGLANFLYADFSLLDVTERELPKLIQQIQEEENPFSSFQWLFIRIYDILRESALFAPLAASLHRLHLDYKEGREFTDTLQTIHAQIRYYKQLQPKLSRVVDEVFALNQKEDMVLRYFRSGKEQIKDQPAFRYPDLTYSHISFRPLTLGANGFFTYDEFYKFFYPFNQESVCDTMTTFYGEIINTEDPQEFVNYVLARCLQSNVYFRTCKFCHRYFPVTGNPKTQYCSRLIEGSRKTCKEMGSSRLYAKQAAEQDAVREFRRSYKAHNARVRYGTMTREEFSAWSAEARRRRDLCIAHKLPYDQFVAWLDSDRQK